MRRMVGATQVFLLATRPRVHAYSTMPLCPEYCVNPPYWFLEGAINHLKYLMRSPIHPLRFRLLDRASGK
jgi:hypothetical protein